MTGLPVLTNWKSESHNFMLMVVDCLTKMVHYKPGKIVINKSGLAKVIINVIVCHHGILTSILTD